jgi:transcriptional regulator with XRE-family HTH domain
MRKTEISPVDLHVGQRLRLLRCHRGVSQEKLGAAIKLSFQQIQKYERGANRVSASRLYSLARELGVNPAWFFEEFEGTAPASGDIIPPPTRSHMQLMRDYTLCDGTAKMCIRALVAVIAAAQRRDDTPAGG